MRFLRQHRRCVAAAAAWIIVAGSAAIAQTPARSEGGFPNNVVALEGTPRVRIDTNEGRVSRHQMTQAEMSQSRLTISVDNGQYFWASRDHAPLTLSSSGEFTYLSSAQPGKYVRFRRVNDRLTYVEHVDTARGSVTYWGELRIVLGK